MSTQITYLGHATTLIQSGSVSILTDPILSQRVLMIKRRTPLPLKPEELAPTLVLISHAHYDHLDIPSFKYFSSKVPVVLPRGLSGLLEKQALNPLTELTPGNTHELEGIRITAVPVTHSGFRLSGLTFRNCNGYLIELDGKKIFFPGDTAYRSDFKNLRGVDVALLPIGPCKPEWFMRRNHLNPDDALRVFEEMEAKMMIPIHWGTFPLGLDPIHEPMEIFKKRISAHRFREQIKILEHGQTLTLSNFDP